MAFTNESKSNFCENKNQERKKKRTEKTKGEAGLE